MRLPTLAILAFLAPSTVFAHEPSKGPNGGKVQDVGAYHVELVVNEPKIAVHLTDAQDKPVDVAGAKGTAIVLANKKQESVVLHPSGNAMHGQGTFTPASDMQVVVSITLPGGKPLQAKFAPARAN